MNKVKKVKIAITIDSQILKVIDDISKSTNSNRSEFINRVLISVLGGSKS